MPRKKKTFNLAQSLQRLRETTILIDRRSTQANLDSIPSLNERIAQILNLTTQRSRKTTDMIFFVMYDIEDNRVRRLIVKYLEKKGCHRVQKSIFLADLPPAVYNQMRTDLAEVQAAYDNQDSILIVPISTDYLNSMKIIGKNINLDLILKTHNTLFF
ncbi:MAG: CRISPR-associated endonuclease Cas2 [Bacteroidales bacterium]|nr:CRISPR-associated endonuclease Cas2 [Bacteroidales bacterium]